VAVLEHDPRPQGCRKLAGCDNAWRLRVGDYRVLYEVFDEQVLVTVVRVAHRRAVYDM
jgi:mRNA interferase RelE/StbE